MENDKHIDVTRCSQCGCDRGGVVDLGAQKPVLTCFQCNNRKVSDGAGKQQRQLERV